MLYLFNKKVDKSLLSHGLAIPASAINILNKILSINPSRGKSVPVRIFFEQKTYSARVYNVNLKDSHREMWQILYNLNGDLARAFNNTFKDYDMENQFISLYGEVDSIYIDSFNQNDIIDIKVKITKSNREDIERLIFNNDDDASISVRSSLAKYRKMNRHIGEQLKIYYDFRCQLCGEKPFPNFDDIIVEIHHIDSFSTSLNNNADNLGNH